jgi:hypothetical protein
MAALGSELHQEGVMHHGLGSQHWTHIEGLCVWRLPGTVAGAWAQGGSCRQQRAMQVVRGAVWVAEGPQDIMLRGLTGVKAQAGGAHHPWVTTRLHTVVGCAATPGSKG